MGTQGKLHDLQVADARWQVILSTARDAIIAIDRQARITLFNPAAELVFGYRAEEVLGENVKLLMPAPYRDDHDEYLRRYESTGEARAIGRIRSVQGRRKNGEVFPIELSVSEQYALPGPKAGHASVRRSSTPPSCATSASG